MNNPNNKKNHIIRIIRALLIAPLIQIPIFFIVSLGYSLFDAFTTTEYIGQAKLFSSGVFFVGYAIMVTFAVTLLYGLPWYLALNRFNKASLLNLVLAGSVPFIILGMFGYHFIFPSLMTAQYGAAVAATFWMAVTDHRPLAARTVKGVAIFLVTVTLGLAVTTKVIDTFFMDNVQTARLKRALSNKAPLPEWWERVEIYKKFDNIEEVHALYYQYKRDGIKTGRLQRHNREFFKSAYLTISDVEKDPMFIVELVLLMNLPHIEYPHMAQLQWYALALRLPDVELRVRLLTALLNTASTSSKDYSHATSWSYDLLTENKTGINPNLVAPLCSKLASAYNGRVISHFELSIFHNCKARLTQFANDHKIKSHFQLISEKLTLMEKNLFNPNAQSPSSKVKPD